MRALINLLLLSMLLSACEFGQYTVGGHVSGLNGGELVLQNNSSDNKNITQNGYYEFDSELDSGDSYFVSILQQAAGHECTVANGSGKVENDDIENVNVSCTQQPISVISASGNYNSLDGTWRICRFNTVQDEERIWVISNSSVQRTTTYFDSNDGSCSGVPIADPVVLSTVLQARGDIQAVGWSNGVTSDAPPLAGDGSTLPSMPLVTRIEEHADAGVTTTIRFIDDLASPWRLYQNGNVAISGCELDSDGYHSCLLTQVAAEKQ